MPLERRQLGSSVCPPAHAGLAVTEGGSVSSSRDAGFVHLDPIELAIKTLAEGKAVVVVDDEGRENEGDLIFPASTATAEQTAFMVRHTSGFICVGMTGSELDRLHLPPMTVVNEDRKGTAYSVTVDAKAVRATGISAEDRATTIRVLADSATTPEDLTRPGHVMPLRAVPGGVLRRPGHTEAAVDLVRLAGLPAAGALCELVNDDGSMMDASACREFCDEHGLPLVSIADLIRYRLAHETLVQRVADSVIPTVHGSFRTIAYRSTVDTSVHVALVHGELGEGKDVLVRVHAECPLGDVFGSELCSCRQKLQGALSMISAEGRGVLVYVRPQADQVPLADHPTLGHFEPEDASATSDDLDYGTGTQILTDLGVRSMRLITAHPDRRYRLEPFGLSITGTREARQAEVTGPASPTASVEHHD
jgi:3,4-dihydroxy 2-butanone 4-phosphate synthase / GTP cyclohydrolase II